MYYKYPKPKIARKISQLSNSRISEDQALVGLVAVSVIVIAISVFVMVTHDSDQYKGENEATQITPEEIRKIEAQIREFENSQKK